jgi:hypothetical protein
MNEQLSRLSKARRPVWIEGPGAFGATLASALDGTFLDAREADAPALVDTLRAMKSSGRPLVLGLADAPRPSILAVLYALLHGQLHGPSGTEAWPDAAPLWIAAPRSGLTDEVAKRLRLHARAEALELRAEAPAGAPAASARPVAPPAPRASKAGPPRGR